MNKVLEKTVTTEQIPNTYDLQVKKIVVAVDLSPHSEKTAAYASGFARSFGASVILVHVLTPEPITEFTTQEVHEHFEEERRETEKKLESLAEKVREMYPDCEMELRIGDPAEQVTLVAVDTKADLIITASHHPGFLGRLFGLDQAPRILHRARCPVLVYHEEVEEGVRRKGRLPKLERSRFSLSRGRGAAAGTGDSYCTFNLGEDPDKRQQVSS
ncbi:MAG: universal stress protein [Verrucomicrobia bacterium]|nr:universal stress protein [Verrucomicrobiota bacterium]